MTEFERTQDQMIAHLGQALTLADELHDSLTGYIVECALDETRAGDFRLGSHESAPRVGGSISNRIGSFGWGLLSPKKIRSPFRAVHFSPNSVRGC